MITTAVKPDRSKVVTGDNLIKITCSTASVNENTPNLNFTPSPYSLPINN